MIFQKPTDGWGKLTPRDWQVLAHDIVSKHFDQKNINPSRAIIRAVMGSGKSLLMAQILASCVLEKDEVIVVSTPTIKLVRQLTKTFRARLDDEGFMQGQSKVGQFFTFSKDIHTPIIVVCTPSALELSKTLQAHGKKCVLWMPDEAHKTTSKTINEAYEALKPQRVLGLTATPWRAKEGERLHLFDKLLFDFSPADARSAKNVVVPWRFVFYEDGETNLDDACISLTELARGPGLYNAVSISDAIVFAERLRDRGIKAEAVHSKLGETEVDKRIEDLRTGKLDALVHVNMLQEGVDLPWLCWLCMRRPVSSTVRFCQEIGRVLRYFDGLIWGTIRKTEAVVYDPHCLLQSMSLDYDAVLGGVYDVDEPDQIDDEIPESKLRQKILEQSVFAMMEHLCRAKAGKEPLSLSPLAGYLTELLTGFDVCGLLDERKIASRNWRSQGSSPKQQQSVKNLKWTLERKCVPRIHSKALSILSEMGAQMSKGMASDMMSVMLSVADKRKWPDFKELDKSAESSMKRHEAKAKGPQGPPVIRPVRPDPLATPPREQRTPQQIKKDIKEAEKKMPSLFD